MKLTSLILLAPALVFSQWSEKEMVIFSEKPDEILSHLEQDADLEEDVGVDNDGHSLFEIKEDKESLIPWLSDDISFQDLSGFIEDDADAINEEFEDAFTYEVPYYQERVRRMPTYERVTDDRRRLFNRRKIAKTHQPGCQRNVECFKKHAKSSCK